MPFPTATVTQGSGLTVNTLPNAGQATMANSLGVAIASDQSAFPATSLNSGAITNPTSVLTRSAIATSSGVNVSTSVSPYFTWTGANPPPVNGQGFYLSGTTVPGGFTQYTTYWVVGVSGSTFNLSATLGGAAIVPTSTGTPVTATLEYKPNDLIATSATTPVVPSFAIANSGGGAIIPRVRLSTNAAAGGAGWNGAMFSINLWSALPTYTGGDAQLYAVATGSAGWLANFMVTLTQFGDGAAGFGQLTGANQMALRLASGTAVYWDMQILSFMQPNPSQTFTLTAECLN
jgi:hypothetical protein